MSSRAAQLQAALRLLPHPEGGSYREFFRSPAAVLPADGRGPRAALTAIHFLLEAGQASRWHTVRSDEAWIFLEGDPLELIVMDPEDHSDRTILLGPAAGGGVATAVVPAGRWQAARPTGGYALVACLVGPGFDFADFALLSDDPEAAARLRRAAPAHAALL